MFDNTLDKKVYAYFIRNLVYALKIRVFYKGFYKYYIWTSMRVSILWSDFQFEQLAPIY